MADREFPEKDMCYFYRDLKRGSYGGDVSCLQNHLREEGFLTEEPSGYFGGATEEALQKWQVKNNLVPAKGVLGFSSRVAYARKLKLPTTEELRAMELAAEDDGRAELIEFTCELVGSSSGQYGEQQQQSLIRKCKEDAPYADRMHLCGEACQMAVSEACDKAFPTSQNVDYKKCLSLIPRNCQDACKSILSKGDE